MHNTAIFLVTLMSLQNMLTFQYVDPLTYRKNHRQLCLVLKLRLTTKHTQRKVTRETGVLAQDWNYY